MRYASRHILSYFVLALYASISLLGQGLHWLSGQEEHHHGLLGGIACSAHEHAGHLHLHTRAEPFGHDEEHDHEVPDVPSVTGGGCLADLHDCDLCQFLDHSVSQPPQPAMLLVAQHIIASLPWQSQVSFASASLGLPSPRGPPQLSA
ncbi:MAG: hypothetical protein IT425_14850 [Pirellulales bacterium]|nr:hypothetical protein [Pirellulales bacterium]